MTFFQVKSLNKFHYFYLLEELFQINTEPLQTLHVCKTFVFEPGELKIDICRIFFFKAGELKFGTEVHFHKYF